MKKILILEDEEALGRIYQKKLQEAGYEVNWKQSVEEAEQVAHNFAADLVLVDHGIRGKEKSGLDFLPDLKNLLPHTKVVMLSNYNQPELERAALNAGASAYLVKINTPPKVLVNYVNGLFL
jgi:DNA-binding response OmpR family regulator